MMQRRTVERPEGRLSYLRIGSGPLVVIVNTYGAELEVWEGLIAELAPRFRVITWDCRGFADDELDRRYTVNDHAADLHAILTVEGGAAVVLAWCGSCKVALEFAHRHPDRVRALGLITGNFASTGLDTPLTVYQQNLTRAARLIVRRPHLARALLAALSGGSDEAGEEAALVRRFSTESINSSVVPDAHIRYVVRPFVSEPAIVQYMHMVCDLLDHSIRGYLEALTVPTLILTAAHDPIAHPGMSEEAAQRCPVARLVVLPDADHYCLVTHTARILAELTRTALHEESRSDDAVVRRTDR